jgi:hypothetical protein
VKSKPNMDAFVEGGAAADRPPVPPSRVRPAAGAAAPTEFRKQMVVQLPIALINDLKRRALDQSVSTGRRVTQQQLVEEALRKYLHR